MYLPSKGGISSISLWPAFSVCKDTILCISSGRIDKWFPEMSRYSHFFNDSIPVKINASTSFIRGVMQILASLRKNAIIFD